VSIQRGIVVIPTYNEAANIELLVDRVRGSVPSLDILVVDDNSPDGTGDIVEEIMAHDKQIQVLHRAEKSGLGTAYLAGLAWVLDRGYDVIIEMDADGSHLPEQLPRLLHAVTDADLVLGSRWVPGGRVVNWPTRRELLSRGANTYTRLALGVQVHDATGGYRAFRRETLEGIDLGSVRSQGYCFQIDLARRALEQGFLVVEVPITFVERVHGESKMTGSIVREALWRVSQWGVQHHVEQGRRVAIGRRTRVKGH